MENVFTFWEGPMPAYIQLCLETWKFPYTILTYENLHNYTDLQVTDKLKQFTLPQIADVVRVHVLRDQGGYWLDTDTISITGKLPEENILGNPDTHTNSIGFLHTEKGSEMFKRWAEYQDKILSEPNPSHAWYIMGNGFTDPYVKMHGEIKLLSTDYTWAETYMIDENLSRYTKYHKLYFEKNYSLQDLRPTNLLTLHNSWTPRWYKEFNKEQVLTHKCTLSNILRELI